MNRVKPGFPDGHRCRQIRTKRAVTAAAVLLLALAAGCCWDIYYDLNDDSLMAEMLSGSYLGEPSLRNIQSFFPLTAVLGCLYRLCRHVDWYGGLLLFFQYGCVVLVLWRIQKRVPKRSGRAAAVCLAAAAAAGLLAEHFVYLQYSMTVGILGGTACFLFLTMEVSGKRARGWLPQLLPPVLLILAGFLLRSEMMLFVGPFVALSFLVRAAELCLGVQCGQGTAAAGRQRGAVHGDSVKYFLQVCGLTAALTLGGMGLCLAGNAAGYGSSDWKEFEALFEARTELYDFQKLPTYEDNKEFYDSIGMDSAQVQLLLNYNYGLDQDIDAAVLQTIADYAKEKADTQTGWVQRCRAALWDYKEAMLGRGENGGEPYPAAAAALYLAAIACVLYGSVLRCAADKPGILLIGCLLLLRSLLFLYLFYHHRPVTRLTHSIYLCEAVFLLWLLGRSLLPEGFPKDISEGTSEDASEGTPQKKSCPGSSPKSPLPSAVSVLRLAAVLALCVVLGCSCVWQLRSISRTQEERLQSNAPYRELQAYAREHPDDVYLVDVYSTVSFSDRVGEAALVPINLDLLGGWASKSPLEREKLTGLGLEPEFFLCGSGLYVARILQMNDNVYVAAETGADMEWLSDYYAYLGMSVLISEADRIGSSWVIYAVQ